MVSKQSKEKRKDLTRNKDGKVRGDDTKHRRESGHKEKDPSGKDKPEKHKEKDLGGKDKCDKEKSHISTDKDKVGKRSGREKEKMDRGGDKAVEHKSESKREPHLIEGPADKKVDAVKDTSRSKVRDKLEPKDTDTQERSSRVSAEKQPLRSGSNMKPGDTDRHSSPSGNRRSLSKTSHSVRYER